MADEAVIRVVVEGEGGGGGGGGGGRRGGRAADPQREAERELQAQMRYRAWENRQRERIEKDQLRQRLAAQKAQARAEEQAEQDRQRGLREAMRQRTLDNKAQERAEKAQVAASLRQQKEQAREKARQQKEQERAEKAQARAEARDKKAQEREAARAAEAANAYEKEQSKLLVTQSRSTSAQKSGFQSVLDLIDRFRGTLGGLLGQVAGSTLDVASTLLRTRAPDPGMVVGRQAVPAAPGRPFQPATMVPKKVYSKPPVLGTAPSVVGGQRVAGFAPQAGVLAGGQPGTALGSGLSGAGAVGAGAAILGAINEVGKKIKATINGVADAGGGLARTFLSADTSVSRTITSMGAFTRSIGDSLGPFGALISNVGAFGQALGGIIGEINGLADRYAQFSPQLALAQGVADIRQTLGDFRRGQQAGGDLAQFVQAQSQLQQKFENIKIQALQRILPAVLKGMAIVERLEPVIATVLEGFTVIANAIASVTGAVIGVRERLDDMGQALSELNSPEAAQLPTNLIRNGNAHTLFTEQRREGAAD